MAPKGGATKRKGAATPSAATPLSLYKRGLTAIRSWSPLTSARSDAEALAALTAACQQLQTRMGLPPQPPPPTAAATAVAAAAASSAAPSAAAAAPEVDMAKGDNGVCQQQQQQQQQQHRDLQCQNDQQQSRKGSGEQSSSSSLEVAVAAANGGGGGGGEVGQVAQAQADPLAAVWPGLESLAAGMASYGPVVRHSLDLDLDDWQDEPGFLLASCHLEIGKLLGRMFPRREAAEQLHLGAAAALFPDFVAARLAMGQALLARADHPQQLQQAERELGAALHVADRLAGAGGGGGADGADGDGESESCVGELLLAANGACRREWEAGGGTRRCLAMLLCQEGRDAEAAPHLEALEFTHRLARQVLHYPLDPVLVGDSTAATNTTTAAPSEAPVPAPLTGGGDGGSLADWPRYVRAVDGALPLQLLSVLRSGLAPGGRFWAEHGYGRVGYFSYMHQLGSPALSAIHQAATLLHRLVTTRFPAAAEARYAEWWAHCRRHPSGHQLHFDSDDEGEGGVRNPLVSAVIYLTGGVGGPTLVTPQLLGGPLAPHGWLIHPRENRLGMFDSSVLHGVIPGRGPSPRPGEYRITLMIAFWRDIKCRPRDDGLPGPSQPFPAPGSPAAARFSWMADLPPHPDGPDGWGAADPRDAAPTAIDRVWERLDGSAAQPGAVQYDACFQGF